MKELLLTTQTGSSRILIGNCEEELKKILQTSLLIVADKRVVTEDKRGLFSKENIFLLDGGENIKSLTTAELIYRELYRRGATRNSALVAVGGGTVTDLVGFVAATYLRGLEFISVPTSLLAQVDASVGGKNGVNFLGAKNQIGTIRQANSCFCDSDFLKTLSPELISEGYAEIIKHALLAPSPLLKLLAEKTEPLSLDGIEEIIFETLKEKIRIVEIDELETGERRKLNLGHTIGHAVEAALKIPHGQSVSIGTVMEAKISLKRGLITEAQLEEIKKIFTRYKLPVEAKIDSTTLLQFMRKDKKRFGGIYKMPLLTGLGSSELFEVTEEELVGANNV